MQCRKLVPVPTINLAAQCSRTQARLHFLRKSYVGETATSEIRNVEHANRHTKVLIQVGDRIGPRERILHIVQAVDAESDGE